MSLCLYPRLMDVLRYEQVRIPNLQLIAHLVASVQPLGLEIDLLRSEVQEQFDNVLAASASV